MTKLLKRGALLAVCAAGLIAALPASASAQTEVACENDLLLPDAANQAAVETALLCLLNAYREDSGLARLARDTRLDTAARLHSQDMNSYDPSRPSGCPQGESNTTGFFAHEEPLPGCIAPTNTPRARADAQLYTAGVGENIAMSGGIPPMPLEYSTAWATFDQWRASPGHNMNMLTPGYQATGHGVDAPCWCFGADLDGIMATQMFGVGASLTPADTGPDNLHPIPPPAATPPKPDPVITAILTPAPATAQLKKLKKCGKGRKLKRSRCVKKKKK